MPLRRRRQNSCFVLFQRRGEAFLLLQNPLARKRSQNCRAHGPCRISWCRCSRLPRSSCCPSTLSLRTRTLLRSSKFVWDRDNILNFQIVLSKIDFYSALKLLFHPNLGHLWVVCPGRDRYRLTKEITVLFHPAPSRAASSAGAAHEKISWKV
jgi:hypothetical protein